MQTTFRRLLLAILFSVTPIVALAEECESTVDMADSLDFHKMHVECSEAPTFFYDPNASEADKAGKNVIKTYEQTSAPAPAAAVDIETRAAAAGASPAQGDQAQVLEDNPGAVFNIREPFTLAGGPHSAIIGLFNQMIHYCPRGWNKLKEWSEPTQGGYFLHYKFQCAE